MGIMDLPPGPMRIKAITHLATALPVINRFVLYELLLLCSLVSENATHNMMSASNVAKVIAPNLLWQDPAKGIGVGFDMNDVKRINDLGEDLINHRCTIFPDTQYVDFLYKLSGQGSFHCCIQKKLVFHKRSVTVMIPSNDGRSLYTVDSAGLLQVSIERREVRPCCVFVVFFSVYDRQTDRQTVCVCVCGCGCGFFFSHHFLLQLWSSSSPSSCFLPPATFDDVCACALLCVVENLQGYRFSGRIFLARHRRASSVCALCIGSEQ
jgi:RhoGAP domain